MLTCDLGLFREHTSFQWVKDIFIINKITLQCRENDNNTKKFEKVINKNIFCVVFVLYIIERYHQVLTEILGE